MCAYIYTSINPHTIGVLIYVYIYIYLHIYIYTPLYVFAHMYTCVHTYVLLYNTLLYTVLCYTSLYYTYIHNDLYIYIYVWARGHSPPRFSYLPHCAEEVGTQSIATSKALRWFSASFRRIAISMACGKAVGNR